MAAVLTLGTVAVAANGKTVTATISGGTGSGRAITNATGIFVKLNAGPVPTFPIASVGVVGSTLTVTLSQPVGSGETVQLDIGTGSNLTDSGGNTATGQTNVAITNNSTTAVTFYDYASGVFELGCIGEPIAVGGGWNGLRRSTIFVNNAADWPVEFVTDATEFSVICLGSTTTLARIDDGAQATVVADTASSWNMKPITTSALAAGRHLVLCDFGDYFMGVRVAGGTRTMYAVPTTKRTILPNTKAYVGIPQTTELSAANVYKAATPGDGSASVSVYEGFEADVQINGTGLEVLTVVHQSSYWSCEVDGGYAGQLITAGETGISSAFDYARIAAGLTAGSHTLHMTNVQVGATTVHRAARVLNGTVLTSAASASATSLVVASTANLAVNDWVRIDNYLERERRKITAISGSGPYTLTVAALTYAHPIGAQVTSYSAAAGSFTTWKKIDRSTKKYVAVGDSNTEGYNALGFTGTPDSNGVYYVPYDPRTTGFYQMSNTLGAEMVNLGIQGEASSNMVARSADYDASTDYTHGQVDAAFVWAGTNDINGTSITPATFQTQVQSIVTAALGTLKTGAKVYLMPPLTPSTTNAGGLNTATATAKLDLIAAANPTQVVSLNSLYADAGLTAGDINGLHYNLSGQQKIGTYLTGLLSTGWTVSGDINDIVGPALAFPNGRPFRAWLSPSSPYTFVGSDLRMGATQEVTVGVDGTFSIGSVPTGSYQFVVLYYDPARRAPAVDSVPVTVSGNTVIS